MTSDTKENGTAMQKAESKQGATLDALLTSRIDDLRKLAGRILDPDRLIKLSALTYRNSEYLQKCSASSVLKAVLDCARMGLEPDGVHAAIVPMNSKKHGWEAQAWPMYRGLVARAYDDESVQAIEARLVYEGETFDPKYGTDPSIIHVPDADAIAAGQVIAAYAVLHMRGRAKFELMYRSELDAIMARSPSVRAGAFSPWKSDPGEMQKKTVLKRLCKTAPLKSQRIFAALAVEAEGETIEVIDVDTAPTPPPKAPTKAKAAPAKAAPPPSSNEPPYDDAPPIGDDDAPPPPPPPAVSKPPPAVATGDAAEDMTTEQRGTISQRLDQSGAKDFKKRTEVVREILKLNKIDLGDRAWTGMTRGEADIVLAHTERWGKGEGTQ